MTDVIYLTDIVEKTGCWKISSYVPTGNRDYPKIIGKLIVLWAYETLIEPFPKEKEPHHTCFNRWCVNPWHVEPLTKQEHASIHGGAAERAKTHCPQGHPYSGKNLITEKDGSRKCRTCRNEYKRCQNLHGSEYCKQERRRLW